MLCYLEVRVSTEQKGPLFSHMPEHRRYGLPSPEPGGDQRLSWQDLKAAAVIVLECCFSSVFP